MMYLRNIISVFFGLICLAGNAQNLMHYATSPNGEMPVVLFPENEGIVKYEYSVNTNMSTDGILDNAEEVVNQLSATPNYKFESINSGRRSLSYKVEITYGSQPLALYPVWVFNRSATKVKFLCNIYARDGQYKFSLTNFETNRNTIRGNAKNDGDPNIIQWQRVNSLLREKKEAIAECEVNSRKASQKSFDYNSRIAFECSLYTHEWNILRNLIYKLVNVCNNDIDVTQLQSLANEVMFTYDINELGEIGLFDKLQDRFVPKDTNKDSYPNSNAQPLIYVSGGEESHEIAGRNEIIKNIIIDRMGYITLDKNLAEISINFTVDTSGRDKAIVDIYDTGGVLIGSKKKGTSESDSENREVAESLYKSFIKKLIKERFGF